MISPEYENLTAVPELKYLAPESYYTVTIEKQLGVNLYQATDGKYIRILNCNPWPELTGDVACFPFNFKALAVNSTDLTDFYVDVPEGFLYLLNGSYSSVEGKLGTVQHLIVAGSPTKCMAINPKHSLTNTEPGIYNTDGIDVLGNGTSPELNGLYYYGNKWYACWGGADPHPAAQTPTTGDVPYLKTAVASSYPNWYNDYTGGIKLQACMNYITNASVEHLMFQKTLTAGNYSSHDGISNADSSIFIYKSDLMTYLNPFINSWDSDKLLVCSNNTKPLTLADLTPDVWYEGGGYYGIDTRPRQLRRGKMLKKHAITSGDVKIVNDNWVTDITITGHTYISGEQLMFYNFGILASHTWTIASIVDENTVRIYGDPSGLYNAHTITPEANGFSFTREYDSNGGTYDNKYVAGYLGVMEKWH